MAAAFVLFWWVNDILIQTTLASIIKKKGEWDRFGLIQCSMSLVNHPILPIPHGHRMSSYNNQRLIWFSDESHIAYMYNQPCATLLWWFETICPQGWQRTTKSNTLWPFAMSYTILQYSAVLPVTSTTFSNTLQPFATFLDFALFNTPPDCVAFSGAFHQTLFTWLVHHSFGFSGIISGQLALHFTNVSCFILLLQLYLCFLLPLLPNTTESSPFNCTTVYWHQILLRLLSSSFSLVFLVYHTDCCCLFWNFITLSLLTWTIHLDQKILNWLQSDSRNSLWRKSSQRWYQNPKVYH